MPLPLPVTIMPCSGISLMQVMLLPCRPATLACSCWGKSARPPRSCSSSSSCCCRSADPGPAGEGDVSFAQQGQLSAGDAQA
jgi:hypothetical protein